MRDVGGDVGMGDVVWLAIFSGMRVGCEIGYRSTCGSLKNIPPNFFGTKFDSSNFDALNSKSCSLWLRCA